MSGFLVRAARAADEAAVLALAREEMSAHEKIDPRFLLRPDAMTRYALYLRDRMREIDSAVFVAEEEGKVIGVVIGSIRVQNSFFESRRYGYVSDLVVDPAARRRGVGRALWERVVLWFRSLDVSVARLHIATRSSDARSFWRSAGAEDFLAEAWIDLPQAAEIAASKHADPASVRTAETASAAREAERNVRGDSLRGDRLAGDTGVL